jgi:hypothetical protein
VFAQARLFHQALEHALCGWRSADIAHAYKQNSYIILFFQLDTANVVVNLYIILYRFMPLSINGL